MPVTVEYAPDFLEDLEKKPRDPVCTKQAKKKIKAIMKRPETIGKQTVRPRYCRHVDVCNGRLVIFWEYSNNTDTVRFLAFKTHKDAFG